MAGQISAICFIKLSWINSENEDSIKVLKSWHFVEYTGAEGACFNEWVDDRVSPWGDRVSKSSGLHPY